MENRFFSPEVSVDTDGVAIPPAIWEEPDYPLLP